MLLKHSYHAPQADEDFRRNLLRDLQNSQRQNTARRKMHRITWIGGGAIAAAAAVAAAFLPFSETEIRPAAPASVPAVASVPLNGATAFALQPLNVKMPGTENWQTLSPEERFSLVPGMEISTPVGTVENTGFGVRNGPAVMLVGMSKLRVDDHGGLKVMDGQAMLDLSQTANACEIAMNDQKLTLRPGAMVLLGVDNDENYATNGAPAPTLAILHGNAAVRTGGTLRELNSGRIYELYDTGTGIFPNRGLSSTENQQRFLPMIDAIRAANIKSW